MHILLTDVLTCPRCGPQFGLIVLADRLEDRRVREGRLGCPNCREEYPVASGVADLRYPAGGPAAVRGVGPAGEEAAYRLGALLGGTESAGPVLLLGVHPETGARLAQLLSGALLVGDAGALSGDAAVSSEINWLRLGASLPFRTRSIRGVALGGDFDLPLLDELGRVLAPGARLVLDPAPAGAADALRHGGLSVLLAEDGVVVASTP